MTTANEDTIQNEDVSPFESNDDVAAALLSGWEDEDAKKPSDDSGEKKTEPKTEADDTDDQSVDDDQTDDDSGKDASKDDEPKRKFVEDENDTYVKVKVGDDEHEVPVKDLKRLFGQEASFTRKAQDLASARKIIEDTANLQVQVFDRLLNDARAAWDPYSKLDFLALARNPDVTEEQLTAVRQEAERRWGELQFLESGLKEVNEASQKALSTKHAEAAKACVEALGDSLTGIEGWGEPLYKEIVAYAAQEGVTKALLNDLMDPATYKLYHKAMLYDKGRQTVTKIKANNAKKKGAAPKKIIKGSRSVSSAKDQMKGGSGAAVVEKQKALSKSGKQADAAELMLARWAAAGEDNDE